MTKASIGLTGLAVMGQNLVLNMESHGYRVAVHNRTVQTMADFAAAHPGKNLIPCATMADFVDSLESPRKIMIMVKAGGPVDAVIAQLVPLLAQGDLIMDCGNSFFLDTERRAQELAARGLLFLGVGVSGGEEGALKGPSIMPGGTPEGYALVEKLFQAISAKVDGVPCVSYIGPRGTGHYVKIAHNGIEYGDMQLIAETYDVLHRCLGLSPQKLYEIFDEWNNTELSSYLIEITRDIFAVTDSETGLPLLEMILDEAMQKGTGKWTTQNALDLGAATPTINAAVESRIISGNKVERVRASKILPGPLVNYTGDKQQLVDAARAALYASKITSYAQGMALLAVASSEYHYQLNFREIVSLWRGGCIIRAELLSDIMGAYQRNPHLINLLLDDVFRQAVASRQAAWRFFVATAIKNGIPVLALSASLAYYDAYRSARLPANLTQAQRDYFGAHSYRRTDRAGDFHTDWGAAVGRVED